ncbi:MAG: Uma2 family endonuclease [Acetobacteraceae bacterium]
MTVEAFLAWEPRDGYQYELVDGQPRAMEPASIVHGLLQGRLARQIGEHLLRLGRSCEVIVARGVIPRVLSADNVRIPDLGVTCSPVRSGQQTIVDPVLLIEILSPSDRAETWSNVWTYTSIPSVQEILVLQSDAVAAHVLRRDAGGMWPEAPEKVVTGDLILASIDFRAALADLYAGTDLVG